MRATILGSVLQISVVSVLAGCSTSGDEGPTKLCISGEVWRCECGDGAVGRHTCLYDGNSFSECVCSKSNSQKGDGSASPNVSSMQSGLAGAASEMSSAGARSGSADGGGGTGGAGARANAGAGGMSAAGAMSMAGGGAGAASGASAPDEPAFVAEPTDDEAAYLFDQTQVRTYNILIAQDDLDTINMKPSAEQWVPAQLEFEGATFGPFKFRYKGSTGSFKAPCTVDHFDDPKAGKCSMKLGFDEVDEELRFRGLKKLNFHAMIQDHTMLRDRLGYSLFRDSNVVAPRAMHAKVLINGKLEGLFIAVEQIDGRFTRARFSEGGEGNVYKEAWVTRHTEKNYIDALETNSDNPVVTGMLDFQNAVTTSAAAVEQFVDREYLMRYLAVDRVIINDDGALHFYCDTSSPSYPGTSHNFYWYQEEKAEKFWLIPWDLDLTFDLTPWVRIDPPWNARAACTCVEPVMYDPQTPSSCDPMVKHLISWQADYEREVDKLIAGPFSDAKVQEKLNTWSTQIRPHVMEGAGVNQAPSLSDWEKSLTDLKAKIASARANRGLQY